MFWNGLLTACAPLQAQTVSILFEFDVRCGRSRSVRRHAMSDDKLVPLCAEVCDVVFQESINEQTFLLAHGPARLTAQLFGIIACREALVEWVLKFPFIFTRDTFPAHYIGTGQWGMCMATRFVLRYRKPNRITVRK